MSYQDTIDYLFGLQSHGIKFGLINSERLMELMGNPHRRFRALHIAGTNGKGSTSAFLASVLGAAGYRVGLYTSPHLVSFTERIRVDSIPIGESRVVELADRVRACIGATGDPAFVPTFFEVTTAMAFTHFAEENVDIAVVETGMGGRLDSTNVITPLVSVITNIDIEHAEFLGPTIGGIAAEKAGIVKKGVPVVTGANQQEAIAVIEAAARKQDAPVYLLSRDFTVGEVRSGAVQRFDYRGIAASYRDLAISMIGRHQTGNAGMATAAIECLSRSGISISENALREGLLRAAWEGRLERIGERPAVILDGAHNPASARVLAGALADLKRDYRRLILVIGVLKDKDYRAILAPLLPLADRVIATRPAYGRALDEHALAAEAGRIHDAVASAGSAAEAIALARSGAGEEDLIVVTGSLYTVGDARAALLRIGETGKLSGLKG